MTTLEDDHANWQPVKIITKCRCYALKLPLPHNVVQLSAKLTGGSLWQWCLSNITHSYSSRDDWLSVRVPESWLNQLSTTASQTVTAEDGRSNDEQGPEREG